MYVRQRGFKLSSESVPVRRVRIPEAPPRAFSTRNMRFRLRRGRTRDNGDLPAMSHGTCRFTRGPSSDARPHDDAQLLDERREVRGRGQQRKQLRACARRICSRGVGAEVPIQWNSGFYSIEFPEYVRSRRAARASEAANLREARE
jgi:hypothetical protein